MHEKLCTISLDKARSPAFFSCMFLKKILLCELHIVVSGHFKVKKIMGITSGKINQALICNEVDFLLNAIFYW